MWEFIDKVVYINLDKRQERDEHMKRVTAVFPPEQVLRFSAIEAKPGSVGCTKSHIAVMKMAISQKWKNVLILEDDVVWNRIEEGYALLEKLASQHYDVIHLGPSVPLYDVNTLRLYKASTTSSYLVNGSYLPTLLSNFQEGLELLLNTTDYKLYACDVYWNRLISKDTWYVCIPCLMYQQDNYSDIDQCVKLNTRFYWTLNPNMITVELSGGLGNQLFQLAFLEYVSRKNSAIPFIETTQPVSTHSDRKYFDTVFKNWACCIQSTTKIDRVEHEYKLQPMEWDFGDTTETIKAVGYFQNYRYVHPMFYKKIDFTCSLPMLQKYPGIENCIFIHIRGGDYLQLPDIYNLDLQTYYEKAVAKLGLHNRYVVFTNDKAHALTHRILNNKLNFTFIDENEVDTLFLMSKCAGGICANSSFSWWGGCLNILNNEKSVITLPSKWYTDSSLHQGGYYPENNPRVLIIDSEEYNNRIRLIGGRIRLQ